MALLNPLSNAFGLDIGDRAFKLVQISKRSRSKNPYRITAWADIDVPEGVMLRGEILDMDAAVALLGKLIKSASGRLKGAGVVACLPESKTFIKIVEIDSTVSEDKLRRALLTELEQDIPLPVDDIYFDWEIIEEAAVAPPPSENPEEEEPAAEEAAQSPATETAKEEKDEAEKEKKGGAKAEETTEEAEAAEESEEQEEKKEAAPVVPPPPEKKTIRVLLGAAPKNLVDNYTTMLERAGLAPIALEIEAMAITRAIIPASETSTEAIGVLDIGATRSSLVIYDYGVLQMSISIPISGIDITKAISEALNVSFDDAELLKKECGLDANRCEDKMWKILLPHIDDMTEKIRNALRFYKIGFPSGKKIEKLYLCGGGALFREIDTVLSRKLTIKVRRGDALANIAPKLPRAFPADGSLTYTTALGLGLRAADENEIFKRSF